MITKRVLFIGVIGVFIAIAACVTINIYFPAEKVESVAGEIVNEIRGNEETPDKDMLEDKGSFLLKRRLLALVGPAEAWADEVTTVSNPTIRAVKGKMKSRFPQLKPNLRNKMLREGDNGYVVLGKTKGLNLKDKRNLKNLMDAENRDRAILYKEVAKALKIDSSQINKIAEIFAKEWQKSAK